MSSGKKMNKSALHAAIEQCETRLFFSTYVVNTASDAVNPGAGLTSLRQAITAANAHAGTDTISFSSTVFPSNKQNVIKLQQGELQLLSDTTINGPGSGALSIDGNKTDRVFQISNGVTVSLNGLTLTDGSVTGAESAAAAGGGVLNAGTLHLTNVTVSNNTATGGGNEGFSTSAGSASGGGIYSTGSLSLINSLVTGNTARGGTAYYPTDGSGRGGGVFSGGPLTVTGSTISNNTAASGSTNETLDGNGGESDGGGVYAAGSLSISSSTLSGNIADGGDGTKMSASFNRGAPGYGGGVFAAGASIFNNVTFSANGALGGDSGGGGGYGSPGSGGAIFSSGSVVMTSSLLTGNGATGGSGAFDDSGAGGNASGGAITAQASLNISSSTITSNSALGGDGQPNDGEGASAFGGGIYSGRSLVLTSSTVSGNIALASQGGAGGERYHGFGGFGEGGGVYANGTAVIANSTLAGNSVTGGSGQSGYGGGNAADGGDGDGGAIYNNAELTITNSTLTANAAVGGPGGDSYNGHGGNGANGSGSAVYSVNSVVVDDSTITGNTTAGGAAGSSDVGYPAGGAGTGSAAVRIAVAQGIDTINNTIVSGNLANGSTENDLLGDVEPTTNGNNLVGTSNSLRNGVDGNIVGVNNPMLSPLANYGGPTQTMLPLYTSPAVNAGNSSLKPAGVTTDQRGYSRIFGSKVDIGADELQAASVSGSVFNDQNGDGIRQAGEPAFSGVTVYADLSNTGAFISGEPTGITNSSGNYTLYGVPEGTVVIRQVVPNGYRQSFPIGQAGAHVKVTPAGVSGALFADSTRLYISGSVTVNGTGQAGVLVYADLNNDGKFESNENNKATTTGGGFAFQSLSAGTYTFRVVPPTGTTIAGNAAITVTLGSGGTDQNVSFALTSQTTQKLTGTIIGTAGSYNNDGNTIAKVFDGNLSTFFDAPTNAGNYAGLDLGTANIISQISYAPRPSYGSRMVGGIFQGSNSADFSSGVVNLYTVTTAPPQGVLTTIAVTNYNAFRYVRYLAPAGSFGNVAELRFFGYTPSAGATFESDGTLMVNGTSAADTIDVVHDDLGTISATVNGITQTFTLSNVLQIVINGGAGNDSLTLDGGDSGASSHGYATITVNGDDGDDTVKNNIQTGGAGSEQLLIDGGTGSDSIFNGGNGDATLIGGDGNDQFSGDGYPGLFESVYGGDGDDTYYPEGDVVLAVYDGGAGTNSIDYTQNGFSVGPASNYIHLADYVNVHKVILASLGDQTVVGSAGNDTITGEKGDDYVSITGGGGNDTINVTQAGMITVDDSGLGSSNISVSDSENVTVIGGNGNDTINVRGNTGPVTVNGGPGTDTAYTDPGAVVTNVEILNPDQAHTKLTGTIIGTAGSYNNQGNTISKVFDGNLTNYFDAPTATGAWAGLDLGSANTVTQVKFAARVGFASRMVGGQIQASNTADFSSGVVTLYTITTAPASSVFTTQAISNSTAYRYYRYIGPTNSSCNIAELEFDS